MLATIQWVFGDRLMRRIFGLKRDKIIRGWRKLHNEELHNLYFSPNIIRMFKSRIMKLQDMYNACMKRNQYRCLMGKPAVKRLLGRKRRKLEDNIKIDIKIGWDSMWINLA
jgi:hypothetical protein